MEKKPYHHLPDGTFRNPEGSPERNTFRLSSSLVKRISPEQPWPLPIKARFSFAYDADGKIVSHHSSILPET